MAGGLTFKMADQVKSVREVTVFSDNPRPRIFDFTIGASAPTIIRDEETLKFNIGGGYGYKGSSRAYSSICNRFIYWKINENVLELLEESLDVNLIGNNLKIKFTDGMLLPGLSIFETPNNVCVLVATTNSVHRIAFPHPNKLHSHAFGLSSSDQNLSSIFNTSSVAELREPWNLATFSSNCVSSSAWLCQDGHTLFALATSVGSILLVKLPPVGVHEEAEQFELQQSSVMQRLWSGLVPSSLRGDSPLPDGVIDLQIQPLGKQMCIITLCRDHKLRIWSCQKQECISVKDLLDDIPDDIDGQTVTAQNHMLRMTVDPTTGRIYIGAFLSFQYQNQFCVYEAVADDEGVSLSPVSNLYSAVGRLVDFALSSAEIWTQWISNDGESVTYFSSIENGQQGDSGWHKVLNQSSINLSVLVPPYMEPREVYLEELFFPGRFSNQVIIKALQIYQHGSSLSHNTSTLLSDRNELKRRVINLIDTEIQLSAPSNELMYSEYYDLQLSCWEKFYSCVVQYHEVGHQPLGLFINTETGIVGLVRKEMLSILRPCDGVEQLYSQTVDEETFMAPPFLITDKSIRKDLTTVCSALKLVSHQLTQENKAAIHNDLTYKCDPSLTTKQISESLITSPADDVEISSQHAFHSEFTQEIETSLQKVSNLYECFDAILRSLDLSGIATDNIEDSSGWTGDKMGSFPKLGSQLMRGLLAHCFQQTMETRLSLCRDFLVLLGVIERLSSKAGLDPHYSQDISSLYIPQTVLLLRVYHCLHWSTKLLVTPAPSNAVESNLKQLAALEISDGLQAKQAEDHPNTTVLELFLSTTGGAQLSRLMSKLQQTNKSIDGYKKINPLGVMINQAVYTLTGVLWPSEASTIFPEFLLTNYQYMHLQEYCQLLDTWCDNRQSYRLFLCGQSYLVLGENFKALDCFLHATEGASMDDRLIEKLLQADVQDETSLKVLFYVKVMRLFEQFDAPDLVIFVANTAISIANPDDPNIPNLWSNIFKHHLHLGHNDEAYAALTSNPDPSRKRDCLHRFMVVLCERGQLQELCEYPYVNLHDEFVDIMESHARTVDIATHQYYDLLYAFHVFRGNYRKAGSVMYEYGGRLGRELPGKQGLQKQAKCYLAALNALRLVDPKNAWIVTPWDRAQKKKIDEPPNTSPKRKQGDEESWYGIDRHSRVRRKLTVIEIQDLEKEYLLVLARLQLLRVEGDPSEATGPPLTPQETLTLLTQAGLFDTAFTVASVFNLPRDMIFEGLAARCVRQSYNLGMSRTGGLEDNDAWEWLLENDTGDTQPARDRSVADQAWKLLQGYLDKLRDTENGRCYYRCVASKLLSIGAPLPTWLINDYKRLNPAELLYLYVTYDMLQEAADLAIEYISAVLGEGKEYFGLKTALHATMPSVWLPYTTIDHLLAALQSAPPDSNLAEVREELLDRLDRYHEQVERVSEDMTTAAWKRAQRRNAAESLPWQ